MAFLKSINNRTMRELRVILNMNNLCKFCGFKSSTFYAKLENFREFTPDEKIKIYKYLDINNLRMIEHEEKWIEEDSKPEIKYADILEKISNLWPGDEPSS